MDKMGISVHKLADNTFSRQPPALYVLFFAELWERFSYMGIRVLLVLYMTSQLHYSDSVSYGIYGMYFSLIYASTLIGGYLADRYLGNRQAIFLGGLIIVIGHICLALPFKGFFSFGLAFIIVGTGFFKGNISSLLGQYYQPNDPRRDSGFTILYMGINLGGVLAPFICGYVGRTYGWHYGFGLAGFGMVLGVLSLIIGKKNLGTQGASPDNLKLHEHFFLGFSRYHYIVIGSLLSVPLVNLCIQHHDAVEGLLQFLGISTFLLMIRIALKCKSEDRKRMLTLIAMLPFYMAFWASFEQAGASINLFTDRHVDRLLMGIKINTIWFQSLNPFFIIVLAPFFSGLWLYLGRKGKEPFTPFKFALALFQVGLSFWFLKKGVEEAAQNGMTSMTWIILAYLLQSTGEICLSPVGLSMVTKLAPPQFASFMMGALFLSMAFANFIAQKIAKHFTAIQRVDDVSSVTNDAMSLVIFGNTFEFLIYLPVISGLLIILISPFFKKVFKQYG